MSTCGDGKMATWELHFSTRIHREADREAQRHIRWPFVGMNRQDCGQGHDTWRPKPIWPGQDQASRQTTVKCISTCPKQVRKSQKKQPTMGQTKGTFPALHCHKSKWNMYKCLYTCTPKCIYTQRKYSKC